MPPDSPKTPRKRAKVDSFATSLSQLVDSLQMFSRSLAAESTLEPSQILQELEGLSEKRENLEAATKRDSKSAESQGEQQQSWKDEVDRLGTDLWNRSTALRSQADIEEDAAKEGEWRKVIALMRLNAYKLISLGSIEPLTDKNHAALLSLSTKTANALRLANKFTTADEMLGIGADHCATFDLSSPDRSATVVRSVLAHYTARMSSSVLNGKNVVAEWIKGKIKQEVLPELNEREVIKLAEASFETARWIRAHGRSNADSASAGEGGSANAIPWLLWTLELLEGVAGDVSKAMQINVLSALAESHLEASPPQSGVQKAEETINQLLLLQPSAEAFRRRLRMVLARGAGDGEVIKAFVEAASASPWTERDGVKLLHEVRKLPPSRTSLTSEIVSALIETAIASHQRTSQAVAQGGGAVADNVSAATTASSPCAFLAQLVMLAVLVIKDKGTLCYVFTRVAQDAPNFRLDSNSAFLCATYIWHIADKSHAQGEQEVAARLYLLCTRPMMLAIRTTWAKSLRKAALCLSDLKRFDEADENLRRAIALDDVAKSHFVRFYNFAMNQQVEQASACLDAMVAAKAFSAQLLLWSAKAAQGTALKPLLEKVLECLLQYCKANRNVESSVDLLALVRCLIRMTMERLSSDLDEITELVPLLQRHFETALEVAISFSNSPEMRESLTKNVTWLQKTGFNICVRLQSSDHDISGLSSAVVGLMELECKRLGTPDPDTQARLWTFRLAALTEDLSSVQSAEESEQHDAHEALLIRMNLLKEDVESAKTSKSTKDTAHQVLTSLAVLEMDARAARGDWPGALETLKSSFRSALSTEESIKMLAQRAAEDPTCPSEIMIEILTFTLKNLFSKRALDPSSAAAWIRLVAGLLIDDKPAEAFVYFEGAANFISDLGDKYPVEEQSWVTIAAWDKGIDYFVTGQAPAEGRRWCELAKRLAQSSQSPLLTKMQDDFNAICEKCPMSDEAESTLKDSM